MTFDNIYIHYIKQLDDELSSLDNSLDRLELLIDNGLLFELEPVETVKPLSISDVLKTTGTLEPVETVEPIPANELMAPLPDFDYKPIVVEEWEMPGFGVPVDSLPPAVADPGYWDESIMDAISQTTVSPKHGDSKSVADSFTQTSHNAHDWLIVAEAWEMIEEEWEHKCKQGDGRMPAYSWRGVRSMLQMSGDYYGIFIDLVQNAVKGTGVGLIEAPYWSAIDYVNVTDLIEEYDSGREEDQALIDELNAKAGLV